MHHKIIVKMKFGSHLYGTNTPDSDEDFKGVFLPTKEEILLNRIPKHFSESTGNNFSKNTKGDVDSEFYSFHYFLELCCKGETAAIDMLHAPDNMVLEKSDIWNRIVQNRHLFYTKNLKAFVGYCRKQAAKYGIKGSRIASAEEVLTYLSYLRPDQKMETFWESLPLPEHVHFVEQNGEVFYQVCGKKLQGTSKIGYCSDIIKRFINDYGHRAQLAKENKGIDWKAISHALRAATQLISIYTKGTIEFPLKNAKLLKQVKRGELDYLSVVAPALEEAIDYIEELTKYSNYPEKVNRKFWNRFLIEALYREYNWE
jgi:hypothetical protein